MGRRRLGVIGVNLFLAGALAWAGWSSSRLRAADDTILPSTGDDSLQRGLVGHWKLVGDCRDHSGHGLHGVNHGVELQESAFNGRDAYIEIPASPALRLGTGDFTLSAKIWTAEQLDDIAGDVFELYDPAQRRGFTLSISSSAGGYQSQGTDRHVVFGIDQARDGEWRDCGRPSRTSNYVSNSLTVFRGELYAGITDAQDPADRSHVFRYAGEQQWIDCGRVGDGRTTGVGPLIVHQGELYAVTWTYDWTRVVEGDYDPGRVYRYLGGTKWEDCGQPSDSRTLNCVASYRGRLYVGGGPNTWGVFTHDEQWQWQPSQVFAKTGPRRCFPHAMSRFNGKLYVAYPAVFAFDGAAWSYVGVPAAPVDTLQTHSLEIYQGQLLAGTWPEGKVARYEGGEQWSELGRVGVDGTEVNALVVYNGKLYGGSIPRAEVCRYDGTPEWTSLKRFYSPEGWHPEPPSQVGGRPTTEQVNAWSRVTSLTIHGGRLFASIGSCTSSVQDAPADVRGRVFSMEAGKCVSYDDDLGPGWKHLVAAREQGRLKLYVDGRLVAESAAFAAEEYDLSTERPLRIGFGQTDYFDGKIRDVRLYHRGLTTEELQRLSRS